MIGLFLGDTDFSEIVLKKIIKKKIKYFILDFSKKNKFRKNKNSFRISIGRFGKIINLIKQETKKSFKVIITGGFSNLFKNSIKTKANHNQDITIKGLIKISKLIK